MAKNKIVVSNHKLKEDQFNRTKIYHWAQNIEKSPVSSLFFNTPPIILKRHLRVRHNFVTLYIYLCTYLFCLSLDSSINTVFIKVGSVWKKKCFIISYFLSFVPVFFTTISFVGFCLYLGIVCYFSCYFLKAQSMLHSFKNYWCERQNFSASHIFSCSILFWYHCNIFWLLFVLVKCKSDI